jgi:hypothetical protein
MDGEHAEHADPAEHVERPDTFAYRCGFATQHFEPLSAAEVRGPTDMEADRPEQATQLKDS